MKFWFGFSYDQMKAVDFFENDPVHADGKMTIKEVLDKDSTPKEKLCSVSVLELQSEF